MITKELIENRINYFFGYGNIQSNIWFIGMEEGFDGDLFDLKIRFDKAISKSVIDLQDDMVQVKDHMKWFLPNSKVQKTWGKLIQILLTLPSNDSITIEQIKEFQRKDFGRITGSHACLELMPLPCRSIRKEDWFYNQFGIDYLETRKKYLETIMPIRIKLFKKLIEKNNPKIVICYSFSYLKKWQGIVDFELKKINNLYYIKKDLTHFFVIPHPVARGLTNNDWCEIFKDLKEISSM
jgi:hypothetical protein